MKKSISKIIILFMLICFSTTLCGCWDYVEINDVKYAAGLAIDRDKDTNEYILTIEILKSASDGKSIKSSVVQSRGKTILLALRDVIKKTGKQLQVAHMKIVIVSKEIAEEGIIPAIELINRDVEVRNDMLILISHMETAGEIFIKGKREDEILSYELADTLQNYKKVGEYTSIEVFKLIDYISGKGISAVVPMVKVDNESKVSTPKVFETAIFKGDKMVGKLNEQENLILQLLKEKNLKFIIPVVIDNNQNISLELMDVHRKTKVNSKNDQISMDMYIDMDVALAELAGTGENFVSKKQRDRLKEQAEKYIESGAYRLIEKLQKQYKSDAVGFGQILKEKKYDQWKKVSNDWNKAFEGADINVFVNINIKYSGLTNKNIEVRD